MKGRGVVLATWLLMGLLSPQARSDGGTLRLREKAGPYQVAVFTAPALLRAGPIDISVLVQDATTGEPVPLAQVTVRLMAQDGPGTVLELPATTAAATNKLFHAAKFDLPHAGRWNVIIHIDGPLGVAEVHFPLDAAEPLPRLLEVWPWVAWPFLVIILFLLHQRLIRQSRRPRSRNFHSPGLLQRVE